MKRKPRIKEGMDKGRWRSSAWREFVRSLPCSCADPRCGNCNGSGNYSPVIAAHLRNMSGMGGKPDDFLTYPLSDHIHKAFHSEGQPGVGWQLEQVTRALRAGLEKGVLRLDADATTAIDW